MAPELNQMLRSPIRVLFRLAAAVLGAAVADPLVEGASNAGWFGPERYTDRSTADVLPVSLVSCVLLRAAFRGPNRP